MKDFYLSFSHYTKYQLKNILEFKGTYSFRIYELLKQFERIKHRTFEIDNLREILGLGKNEYKLYHQFKQRILEPSYQEINTKTDIKFKYEEIKGLKNKVTGIKFSLELSYCNSQVLMKLMLLVILLITSNSGIMVI